MPKFNARRSVAHFVAVLALSWFPATSSAEFFTSAGFAWDQANAVSTGTIVSGAASTNAFPAFFNPTPVIAGSVFDDTKTVGYLITGAPVLGTNNQSIT